MSIFSLLNYPINALSCTIIGVIKAIVSGRRISKFLQDDPVKFIQEHTNSKINENDDILISLDDASFCYESQVCKDKTFEHVNIWINKNSFIGIFGSVGSGKTSFLKCLIGDLHLCEGSVINICHLVFKKRVQSILRSSGKFYKL